MIDFTLLYILFLVISSIFRIWRNTVTKNRSGDGVVYAKPIFAVQAWLYITILISAITEYFTLNREVNLTLSLLGFIMYLLGILGREWVIRSLSDYWSADIRIREDHRLIKEGPYRYVRHPNLFCLLIEMNGFCFIPNSYYSFLSVWLIYFPVILVRIYLEEKALIEKFGQEYLDYKKELYVLLPLKKVRR